MTEKLNVLFIEDSDYDAELMRYELGRSGYEMEWKRIQSAEELQECLEKGLWDVILSDHNLPGFSALEALEIFKLAGLDIPFIIVSGQIGEELAADCMRSGCHDYVMKNNLARLGPAVKREVDESRMRREQKRIESELLLEKELFAVTLRSIGEGVIITNITGRVIFINKNAEELGGWSNSEASGRSLTEVFKLYDSEKRAATGNPSEEVIRERKICGLNRGTLFQDKDGRRKAVSASFAPIDDGQGNIVGVVVVFRDISRFIKIEEALARSRDHYHSLFEEFPAMIWQSDSEGMCNYFNIAWYEYTGRDPSEAFGYIWGEAMHPDFSHQIREDFWKAFNLRMPFEAEYLMRRSDNAYRWVHNIARPFIDIDGHFGGYIGSCFDITDIKNILAETQKAREAAEAANIMKNQFLANVSHEVRTPLNGIMGMTELTLGTDLEPEQRENLELIKECSESLLTIIGDILDFSRMEAGKVVLENLDFNLLELMEKTARRFNQSAVQKRLNLIVNILPDVPAIIKGDGHRLQQVLVNLIGNALKFTETGEVRVEVRQVPVQKRDISLEFSVSDTGIGIADEDRDKLFKSFSQVDGTYTRKFGGIGLGLAISQQLVEMMGGTIQLDSDVSTGSRFYFTASFGASSSVDLDKNKHKRIFGCYVTPSVILHILLAEDNRTSRRIASRMLRGWGHTVIEAGNGREALAQLRQHQVDLVLMDVQMPMMDGLQTTCTIRNMEKSTGRHLPIIALTAHAARNDKQNFIRSGMDDYLSKPFTESELFAAVEKVSTSEGYTKNAASSSAVEQPRLKLAESVDAGMLSLVDIGEFLERVDRDEAFAAETLLMFVRESSERIRSMGEALERSDLGEIEKTAHCTERSVILRQRQGNKKPGF